MRKLGMLLIVLAILLLSGWGGLALAEPTEEEAARVLVPDFALLTSTNETIRLSDYRGQVVVLNFWASWCPPCIAEMGEFQELHDELVESGSGVLFLINQIDGRQEKVETGTAYLAKNKLTMTNLLDFGSVGRQIFGIPGLPTTVVIDAGGYLSSYVVGGTTAATVWKMIEGAK